MKKKKITAVLLAVVLSISAVLSGCSRAVLEDIGNRIEALFNGGEKPSETPTEKPSETSSDYSQEPPTEKAPVEPDQDEIRAFKEWSDRLFAYLLRSDSTHGIMIFLKDPEKFGLSTEEPSFCPIDLSEDETEAVRKELKEWLWELQNFDYAKLDLDAQLTYESAKFYLETAVSGLDYGLLYEPVSKSNGVPVTLPVELYIVPLNEEQNIIDYLAILEKVPEYFDEIAAFEKKKAAAGLFMEEAVLQENLQQLKDFVAAGEDHFLIATFEERIRNIALSDKQRETYIKVNQDIVLEKVLPAYEKLREALNKLSGSNERSGGLSCFPGGDAYYEHLIRQNTGSSLGAQGMINLLDETIEADFEEYRRICSETPGVIGELFGVEYPSTNPTLCLRILEERAKKDFPDIGEVDYTVSYLDKSLRGYLSPACYCTLQFDNPVENRIFINCDQGEEPEDVFVKLAHEGFPGHLLQTNYSITHTDYYLRALLETGGYVEGYAEYVEEHAYTYFDGISEETMRLMKLNNQIVVALHARADLGIHYQEWGPGEVQALFGKYLDVDSTTGEWVYNQVLSDPGGYLDYSIGCLEFERVQKELKKKDGYTDAGFHQLMLDYVGVPFDVFRRFVLGEEN